MAFDATFQHAIPGSSLTHKMGDLPHEQPPKFVNPSEALDFFWKQFNRPDMLKQIWLLLEQGATAFAIARAILYKAALMGVIQVNLGIVIYPTIFKMIVTIGEAKGIKVKLAPKMRDKIQDAMTTAHINKKLGRPMSTPIPPSAGTVMQIPKPEHITADAQRFHSFMKAHREQQNAPITNNMPVQPAQPQAPIASKAKGPGLLSKIGAK